MTFARAGVGRALHQFLARYPRTLSERLLQHAGVGPKQLANPDEWLSYRAVVEALEIGAEESNEPEFGVSFAEFAPWTELGTLGHVMFNSPTIGEALSNGCRYFAIHQTAARPVLEVCADGARFIYALDVPDIARHAQHSASMLTTLVKICREASGDSAWAPREIHFKHNRPESNIKARQFFRCPILYGQPFDGIVMSLEDLLVPMRAADAELLEAAIAEAELRLAKLPTDLDFADQVARMVMSLLSSGNATIEHVSATLGSSPRTVQRRLRESGVVFNDLVANIRLELSRHYLGDPSLRLTDVAFLLGYSDLTSFSRAFRRWTGQTAIDFRRDRLEAAAPPP